MSFKRFDPEDFLISADSVAAGAFSGNMPTLTTFFTSSVQEAGASGQYYLNVFQPTLMYNNNAILPRHRTSLHKDRCSLLSIF